jgi:hypothetical protein
VEDYGERDSSYFFIFMKAKCGVGRIYRLLPVVEVFFG